MLMTIILKVLQGIGLITVVITITGIATDLITKKPHDSEEHNRVFMQILGMICCILLGGIGIAL